MGGTMAHHASSPRREGIASAWRRLRMKAMRSS
jgi:hypothetical protein